ncbi:MAG: thioesterase family protein [Steroidobacteraceae bacterium]|jgi:acyl-CoA thioesterase|nr:thioesterase family protein [Steroidobacteraceae bacterium]
MLETLRETAPGVVEAPMEPGWAAFRGAFGGWTAAHALLAARRLVPGLPPASLSIDFLAGIGPGNVRSAARLVHETRSTRFVQVATSQDDAPRALTSVVLAARRPAARVDAVAMPDCPPPEKLARLQVPDAPVTWADRFDLRIAAGRLLQPNPAMRSLFWTHLQDPSPAPEATIAVLADANLPRIFFHFERIVPIATVTMSVHFHAVGDELAGALVEPVLLEAQAQVARDGLFDQQVRAWSRHGTLLATSTQLVRYDLPPAGAA